MKSRGAFTLLELLVVIAIIGILAALIFPAFSRAKQKAQGTQCLNNGKQMMIALVAYTADNGDYYPPNPDDGNSEPGYNWCSGQAGIGQPDEFNPDVLLDPTRNLLVNFLSGNITVFRCPADRRFGKYQGSNPAMIGQSIPAVRTFSMSQAVGTIDPGFDASGPGGSGMTSHSGAPRLSVNGPWLNNQDTHRRDSPWFTFGKASDAREPGPSKLWVLLDEDARGLNDAAFAFGMESPAWFDAPGTYHNGGCGFAFADGHSETHKWQYSSPKVYNGATAADASDEQDWQWMQARTSSK
jgi:prepilin-type N-terminal cleavage/methylation domain-containing protein/prepilin-type processing-associated H-X9-DG protein